MPVRPLSLSVDFLIKKMEHRDLLYQQQPPPSLQRQHHDLLPQSFHESSSSAYTFFPNPNPNSHHIPSHGGDHPFPFTASSSSAAAATDLIQPPGIEHYIHHDPYASQVAYDGASSSIPLVSYPHHPHLANDYYYQQLYSANPFTYQFMKVGSGNTEMDLETKKRKVIEGGARADTVKVCTVCNVVCNSEKVFVSHLTGEKHALKAQGLLPNGLHQKVPSTRVKTVNLNKMKTPIVPGKSSAYCDICKLNCNSEDVLNKHWTGKKHFRNLLKLKESFAPKPVNAPVKRLPHKDQLKLNAAPPTREDLHLKTQNVLNGGADASAVKVCALCNVVCNSETVFKIHIAGKKHLAMVNQEAATSHN